VLKTFLLAFYIAGYCNLKKLLKVCLLGQTKKIISFSGQFPTIFMRQGGTFFSCNNQCWFKCSGSLYWKQPCMPST